MSFVLGEAQYVGGSSKTVGGSLKVVYRMHRTSIEGFMGNWVPGHPNRNVLQDIQGPQGQRSKSAPNTSMVRRSVEKSAEVAGAVHTRLRRVVIS
jgi:hypothetical protein